MPTLAGLTQAADTIIAQLVLIITITLVVQVQALIPVLIQAIAPAHTTLHLTAVGVEPGVPGVGQAEQVPYVMQATLQIIPITQATNTHQ